MQKENREPVGLPIEVGLVWAAFVVVAVEIVATYSRLPTVDLYHVSGSGVEGGLSRATTFSNFPVALAALAIVGLLWERLSPAAPIGLRLFSPHCCAPSSSGPGVVDEGDLDARLVNGLPLAGVILAILLTGAVARRRPLTKRPWDRSDWVRLAVLVVLFAGALPWLAAELGFYSNGVPLLGRLFQSGELLPERPGLSELARAVHHGHHHGMDGLLLVTTALLLSRRLGEVRGHSLRRGLAGYLALVLCYGVGIYANDFWIEQVVKRGWTAWEIPNVLQPGLTIAWGVNVIAAVAVWALWVRLVDWNHDEESPVRTEPDGVPARR